MFVCIYIAPLQEKLLRGILCININHISLRTEISPVSNAQGLWASPVAGLHSCGPSQRLPIQSWHDLWLLSCTQHSKLVSSHLVMSTVQSLWTKLCQYCGVTNGDSALQWHCPAVRRHWMKMQHVGLSLIHWVNVEQVHCLLVSRLRHHPWLMVKVTSKTLNALPSPR